MRKEKRWMAALLAVVLAAGLLAGGIAWQRRAGLRLAAQMGVGINLGNALDVTGVRRHLPEASVEDFETFWQNPPITRALLEAVKAKGFGTVRIPVSWEEHLLAGDVIDSRWMDRVEQVVDWALDCGLYVILDLHHESWLVPTPEKEAETTRRLCRLWSQIGARFAGRGEKLLFEAMNEPRLEGSEEEWTAGTREMQQVVNRLNGAFVGAVRGAGGENEDRWLILPAYGSQSSREALEALELPDDRRLMVAVHAYLPYGFTLGGLTGEWSSGDPADTREINQLMDRLDRLFLSRQIPVVITEFGCIDQDNPEDRLAWVRYYRAAAARKGICCIWWDDGDASRLIDRDTLAWTRSELAQALVG